MGQSQSQQAADALSDDISGWPNRNCTKICRSISIDKVYLGNAACVQDDDDVVAKLNTQRGIRRVLNMAGPMALKSTTIQEYDKQGIDYKCITALDEDYYPLLERDWEEARQFIHDPTNQRDGNIVVHCEAGMNRSALVVAADYMLTCQIPVLETVQHVRRQRGNVALQNEYFQE